MKTLLRPEELPADELAREARLFCAFEAQCGDPQGWSASVRRQHRKGVAACRRANGVGR